MNKQKLQQKNYQKLSPQQIQFLGLLQTPIIDLDKRIEKELEENPALEESGEEEEEGDLLINPGKYSSNHSLKDLDYQIESKSESLSDYLTQQLINLDENKQQKFLVKYLINSLDNNGFLSRQLTVITSDLLINNNLTVDNKDLISALSVLQDLDPVGVGAKDIQECLLIQLKKLHPNKKLAQKIIYEYYKPFSNKNFEYISTRLNVSLEEIKAATTTIQSLNPIPSRGFSTTITSTPYIYPDFTVTLNNGLPETRIHKNSKKTITISNYYKNLLNKTTDDETKRFLKEKIDKALWFKDSIAKREETLKKVFDAIVKFQTNYFITGNEKDLIPMKLADIAQLVSMDISTISRVTNSKYVTTQFGCFKLKELFSEAYKKLNGEVVSTKEIKKKLKEIIEKEDKNTPLTDEKISDLLGENEYHIARRTVSKYREILGIQTAKLRREL